MAAKIKIPKYCRQAHANGRHQAYLTWQGRRIYLGLFDDPGSRKRYHAACMQLMTYGMILPETPLAAETTTINQVAAAYLDDAKRRYSEDGRPTATYFNVRQAVSHVIRLFGDERAIDFGARKMTMLRQALVDTRYVRKDSKMQPRRYARKTVNYALAQTVEMFRFAREMELIPENACRGIHDVRRVKRGQFSLSETVKQLPPPTANIDAIKPYVSPVVWAMIRLQMLSGARPGEICAMRAMDINTQSETWEYRPAKHKTANRGKDRVIYLNREAQAVVQPFLGEVTGRLDAHLFSAAASMAWHRERRRAARKTPLNCGNRPGTNTKTVPKIQPRSYFTTCSYGQAIERGCRLAGVPVWHAHGLRRWAATQFRRQLGLEAAAVLLGHSSVELTDEVYAQRDTTKAVEAIGSLKLAN